MSRAARALEIGATAGALLAALDIAFTRTGYAPLLERLALWGSILGLLVAAGAVAGAIVGLVDQRVAARSPWERALALAAAAAPWWITVGAGLGSSTTIKVRVGAAGPWLGLLGLGAATGVGIRLALALWPRLARRRLGFVPLALLALGLFSVDALVWRRILPAFHGLCLGAGFALLAALVALTRPPGEAPRSRRGWLLRGLAIALLVPASYGLQKVSANVRFVAHEKTTATRQILALVALVAPPAAPPVSPGELPGEALRRAASRAHAVPLPIAKDAHLILLTVDALRPDHLGAWGYPLTVHGQPLSPHLDALAARGVRFERTYAQAPHSAYSITSLLTSDYITSTVQLGGAPPPTLAEILAGRGFRTEAYFPAGLFFNGRRELGAFAGRRFGFDRAITWDLDARELTDHVLRRLDEIRGEGEPRTFLWVHYFDAHEPYLEHREFGLGPSPAQRYDSEIAFLDRQIGRLIAALGQLDRPSVIALTADHGEEFKEHGGWYHGSSLYEEQVRVPLIVVAPGIPPRTVRDPVELVDVAPLLLSLLGEPAAATMRGDDLRGALLGDGGRAATTRPVFAEVEAMRMVAKGGWKLIHDFRRDTWELYDLHRDPKELTNEYDRQTEVAGQLTVELHGWIESLRRPGGGRGEEAQDLLALARLGDRRTVPALAQVVGDRSRPAADRAAAARLCGLLEGHAAEAALRGVLPGVMAPDDGRGCDPICAEAALALAELADYRATPTLLGLLSDPHYRKRAAVALGRLRRLEPPVQPALVELIADPDVELRQRAIHFLGLVGDARAIAPLAARLGDLRARYLIAVALGRIGARSGERETVERLLVEWLAKEPYEDNRAFLVLALGLLGERLPRPSPPSLEAARAAALAEPPVKWATETLVRLHALAGGAIAGVDFAPEAAGLGAGFRDCERRERESTDDYAGATTCRLTGPGRLHFPLSAPRAGVLLVRARPPGGPTAVTLTINGRPLPPVPLEAGWHELRIPAPATLWRPGDNDVIVAAPPGTELDHLLFL